MKQLFVTASILLSISLLLVACNAAPITCTDPLGCLEIPANRSMLVGALVTFYGNQGGFGRQVLDEIKAAIDENGPVLGHDIELTWQGTDCSEENARMAATQLTHASNLLAVIGPTCSADAPIALAIFEDAGLPVISPSQGAKDAFQNLVSSIKLVAIQASDGSLQIPRTALLKAIQNR
jgi:branched-chain amino acid transport system substrate-binding protein